MSNVLERITRAGSLPCSLQHFIAVILSERNSFRWASRADSKSIARKLRLLTDRAR